MKYAILQGSDGSIPSAFLQNSGSLRLFGPPTFADVLLTLLLSQFLDFVCGIPKQAVQDAATGVLPVGISLVGQKDHVIDQFQRFDDMLVTRSHVLDIPQSSNLGFDNRLSDSRTTLSKYMPAEVATRPSTNRAHDTALRWRLTEAGRN
jgi:hypothetical protein